VSKKHPATVYAVDGTPLTLGPVLGKGGEGEVREVRERPALVAKLYNAAMTPERQGKLRVMVARGSPEITAIAAWPVATLHATPGPGSDRPILGFLMPRLADHKELHKLSHPMDRLKNYPELGYDFLVHVAANVARAFDALHRAGIVVGDVNESGVMVKSDGTVMLIDCDSMQIVDGATTYPCDVGKPEFQPPEILSKTSSFRGLIRTVDNDRFGLGVLIFQLLFFGWHPFAVRMLDGDQQPTADNIKAGRFPYGRDFYATDFTRPPLALDPAAFPDAIRALIEDAFAPHAGEGERPRPNGRRWAEGLERMAAESIVCTRYMTHVHHGGLARCPFCELDLRLGFAILPHVAFDASKLREVWQQIQAAYFELSTPTPPPEVALPEPAPLPEVLARSAREARLITWIELAVLAIALGLAFVTPWLGTVAALLLPLEIVLRRRRPASYRDLALRTRAGRVAFEAAEAELAAPDLPGLSANFQDAKHAYERIVHHDSHRQRELIKVHEATLDLQARRHLARHRLRSAGLAAIPGAVVVSLEKQGYDTAADVLRLRQRPPRGLAPAHLAALARWEKQVTTRFVPDLDDPDYLLAIDARHRELDAEHAHLMQRLLLSRDWLVERLPPDRRRRAAAREAYLERWTSYGTDLQAWRAASARFSRRASSTR
jgi:DNA-binding helix-hairpin-helix protein with protein kinase domain